MSLRTSSKFSLMLPCEARKMIRSGVLNGKTTSGFCLGYIQANIAVIPSEMAQDFKTFCEVNKAPCPMLYCSKPGEVGAPPLAENSDIRTDLPQYCASENGVHLEKKLFDLTDYSWDDFVTFYIGCSFSFEEALVKSKIPVQNIEKGRNVSMYKTNIQCHTAGPFSCPMIVSMRPIPKELVEKAVQITAEFESVHGAPIHIGDPQLIGIQDLSSPDFGEPSELGKNEIPLFWACGVTSAVAIKSGKPKISFSHSPGCMYIGDVTTEKFLSMHKPSHGSLVPKTVTLTESPLFMSMVSDVAIKKITELENIIQDDPNNRGIKHLHIPGELLKAGLTLSHCRSVGITTGFPCNMKLDPPDENDGPPGALMMAKALQSIGKSVSFLVRSYHSNLHRKIIKECISNGLLSSPVPVVEYFPSPDKDSAESAIDFLFPTGQFRPPLFDMLIAIEASGKGTGGKYYTMRAQDMSDICGSNPVDDLFQTALATSCIRTVGIGDGGNEIGMGKVLDSVKEHIPYGEKIACHTGAEQLITAGVSNWGGYALATTLYILQYCPVHSRYLRRGIGEYQPLALDQFINSNHQEQQVLEMLADQGVYDSTAKKPVLAVDGLDFHVIHTNKLQEMRNVAHSFCDEVNERK